MESVISIKEYQAALKQNRLLGCRCLQCGFITAPPRLACRQCSAHSFEIVELSGKGRIATFTAVYIPTHHRIGKTPYLVALVEMNEGPWVMGNLVGIDAASASIDLIGQKVRMDNSVSCDVEPAGGIARPPRCG